ncbi:hypothetical protein OH491_14330 [Termitidicoccus mucosus]|uniref:hypothetical protein n=1 Tax=Termitidicoccus mucosus TaxID=1184151 RepID=UPI0011AB611F
MNAFIDYRNNLASNPVLLPPRELLEDDSLTEVVKTDVHVDAHDFTNRLEAGKYLHNLLEKSDVQRPERDAGLWGWLTLFFFDQVCPADGHGSRKVMAFERLIPQVDNFQRFYRHLLLGPFLIVRAHDDNPERALAYLCNPLWKPGEIAEQLAARKELVTNPAMAEVATKLYYDHEKGNFRRGAGSSVKGAARRLADLVNQLDLTWYLYGMSADEILRLLPKEFDRFKTKSA